MKKFVLILVLLFTLLPIKLDATCAPGWMDGYTIIIRYPNQYSGCEYTVTYCYRLVNGILEYQIDIVDINLNNVNCGLPEVVQAFNSTTFWNILNDRVCSDLILRMQGSIPPCPQTLTNVKQYYSTCWALKNNGPEHTASFIKCNYAPQYLCIKHYIYCKNSDGTYSREIVTITPPIDVCTQVIIPPVPPIGKTYEDYWISDCSFKICE
jgi:hypothetical protein